MWPIAETRMYGYILRGVYKFFFFKLVLGFEVFVLAKVSKNFMNVPVPVCLKTLEGILYVIQYV